MMSRNTYLISGTAALVVFGGGLMFWQMPSGDSTPEQPVRMLTQPAKQQAALPAAAPQPNVPEPAFSDLTLRYRNAKDLRVLMLYIKQHPEKGGSYYANEILNLCGALYFKGQNTLQYQEEFRENYAQRAEAFSKIKSLCQGFLPEELDRTKISPEWKEIYEKDRLLALTSKAAKQTRPHMNPEQRAEYKKALLQNSDAIFHGAIGLALAYNRTADGQHEYWLNGHRVANSGPEFQDMKLAFDAVGFELGLASDSTDPRSLGNCVISNFCYSSADQYVRKAMEITPPEGREDRIQRIIQWRKQIGAAILAKDVAFFLPR